jgi:hypothetical protein
MQRHDDPFLPFGKAVISVTRDLICAVMFDFAAYLALGAAGIVALERSIAYTRIGGDTLAILHFPLASDRYGEGIGRNALDVDAVTVSEKRYAPFYSSVLGGGVYITDALETPTNDLGIFRAAESSLLTRLGDDVFRIKLFNDAVINAGYGDDFADQARTALITAMRQT